MRAAVRSFGAALLFVLPACTFLLKTDQDQCTTDADCTARGSAFAGAVCINKICSTNDPLRCVGHVAPAPAPTTATVDLSMTFFDAVNPTQTLGAGITVQACAKLDVGCTKKPPIADAVITGKDGRADFTVPAGFDGYLQINTADNRTVPALWYFSPTPTENRNYNVLLLSPASFQGIAQTVGATIDATKGHAFNIALDCTANYGVFAKGVSFAVSPSDDETKPFYFINGQPNTQATETDLSGIGGFANLPPGFVTVTSSVATSGAKIGSVSTLIRQGTITYAPIAPTP